MNMIDAILLVSNKQKQFNEKHHLLNNVIITPLANNNLFVTVITKKKLNKLYDNSNLNLKNNYFPFPTKKDTTT